MNGWFVFAIVYCAAGLLFWAIVHGGTRPGPLPPVERFCVFGHSWIEPTVLCPKCAHSTTVTGLPVVASIEERNDSIALNHVGLTCYVMTTNRMYVRTRDDWQEL
jgi:hypothetical protein